MKGVFRLVCAAAGLLWTDVVRADRPLELKNPGFEDVENGRARGWTYGANFKATRDGHNGSGGLVWTFTDGLDNVDSLERCAWQDVGPLKKDKRYVVSLLVRPEGVQTERPSQRQGISVRLEGFDSAGQCIVRTRAYPLPQGTRDWVKLEHLTPPMPQGVVNAKLEIFACCCTAGSAALDQISLFEQENQPVEAVNCSAYRDEAVDGLVTFAASLNYETDSKPEEYEVLFSYQTAAGDVRKIKASEVNALGATVKVDVGDMALGANPIGCELRKDGAILGSKAMTFTRLENPVPRRVSLDRYGRTIIDGKPTFLMGMFWGGVPIGDEMLRLYTEGEFNILCSEIKSREELDLLAKYGLYAAVRASGGYDDPDHGLKRTREIVEMAKDHPATALVYINDEQPVANEPWVRARKNLVWELDPNHPTWCAHDRPGDARDHLGGYDILGCDPYPVGNMGGEGNVQDTFRVLRKIREHNRRNFGLKPAIHIPQYFGWAWFRTRTNCRLNRTPTPHQMANMSWQMIAEGANGLIGYSFKYIHMKNRDKARPYEKSEFYWPVIKAFVHDIRRYEDVILSIELAPAIVGGLSDTVSARVWRKGGDVYLLVVNGEDKMANVSIRLSEAPGNVVDWDFCDKPEVKGDVVTFCFQPCGFGMVRLGQR